MRMAEAEIAYMEKTLCLILYILINFIFYFPLLHHATESHFFFIAFPLLCFSFRTRRKRRLPSRKETIFIAILWLLFGYDWHLLSFLSTLALWKHTHTVDWPLIGPALIKTRLTLSFLSKLFVFVSARSLAFHQYLPLILIRLWTSFWWILHLFLPLSLNYFPLWKTINRFRVYLCVPDCVLSVQNGMNSTLNKQQNGVTFFSCHAIQYE